MIDKHVTSLELSKKLKELGVKQESYFWWTNENIILDNDKEEWRITDMKELYAKCEYISAFLASELAEILPKAVCEYRSFLIGNRVFFEGNNHVELESTEANARAKMLIYLIENKHIDPSTL